ncbi:hypothetical protein EDC04DRAFT_2722077 [Pisolithus marmoratus]|nr:hypothetical protein EDC04DRAFT_2722077 [Pisolithus marmoratus]
MSPLCSWALLHKVIQVLQIILCNAALQPSITFPSTSVSTSSPCISYPIVMGIPDRFGEDLSWPTTVLFVYVFA